MMMNVGVSVKLIDDQRSCKKGHTWNCSTYDCERNKACKIGEYLDVKNYSCKRRFFGKLVLASEDELLNVIETTVKDLSYAASVIDKKVSYEKIIALFTLFHQ